jgi:hypothetical protein
MALVPMDQRLQWQRPMVSTLELWQIVIVDLLLLLIPPIVALLYITHAHQ